MLRLLAVADRHALYSYTVSRLGDSLAVPYLRSVSRQSTCSRLQFTMDVDPLSVGVSEPSAAPSPSLKRPQEDTTRDDGNASKRPKAADIASEDSEKATNVDGTGEGEAAGDEETTETGGKGKGDKRGDGKKKQRSKKGKEKEYVRSRRRGTRPEGEEAPPPENGEPKAPRLPKRPCALLIGFCGDGYNGMQMYVSIFSC